MFGLHPALAPLLPLWNSGKLAAVHATGLPAPNRSHFAAMEEVEDADPGSSVRSGWLNRLIGQDERTSPLQAFSVGGGLPPGSLDGPADDISAGDVASMAVPGADPSDSDGWRRLRSLHRLWDGQDSAMGRAMRATLRAVDEFGPVQGTSETPAHGATYPSTDLGRALAEVARIVRGDVGVEVLTVDQGDWDHHSGLGTPDRGRMFRNATDLASSIAAFFADLGAVGRQGDPGGAQRVRPARRRDANDGPRPRLRQCDAAGRRRAWSAATTATWPGLTEELDADLLVTTDYRSVLSEVVSSRFGASPATVFPGFAPQPVGVMRGA